MSCLWTAQGNLYCDKSVTSEHFTQQPSQPKQSKKQPITCTFNTSPVNPRINNCASDKCVSAGHNFYQWKTYRIGMNSQGKQDNVYIGYVLPQEWNISGKYNVTLYNTTTKAYDCYRIKIDAPVPTTVDNSQVFAYPCTMWNRNNNNQKYTFELHTYPIPELNKMLEMMQGNLHYLAKTSIRHRMKNPSSELPSLSTSADSYDVFAGSVYDPTAYTITQKISFYMRYKNVYLEPVR